MEEKPLEALADRLIELQKTGDRAAVKAAIESLNDLAGDKSGLYLSLGNAVYGRGRKTLAYDIWRSYSDGEGTTDSAARDRHRIQILSNLATAALELGRNREAIGRADAMLQHSKRAGDAIWLARAHRAMAQARKAQGDLTGALRETKLSLTAAEQSGDAEESVRSLVNLGAALGSLNKLDTAAETLETAARLADELDDRRSQLVALRNLSEIEKRRGDHGQAAALSLEVAEMFRFDDELGPAVEAYLEAAALYRLLDQPDRAATSLDSAFEVELRLVDDALLARCHLESAAQAVVRGEFRMARVHCVDAVNSAERCADLELQAVAREALGNVLSEEGNLEKAADELIVSLEIAGTLGDRESRARLAGELSSVYAMDDDAETALDYFTQMTMKAADDADQAGLMIGHQAKGVALLNLERNDEAVVELRQAAALAELQSDRLSASYCLDLIGFIQFADRDIEKATTTLERSVALRPPDAEPEEGERFTFSVLAECYIIQDRQQDAVTAFRRAISSVRPMEMPEEDCALFRDAGKACLAIGERLEAEGYLTTALRIAEAIVDDDEETKCLRLLVASRTENGLEADTEWLKRLAELGES